MVIHTVSFYQYALFLGTFLTLLVPLEAIILSWSQCSPHGSSFPSSSRSKLGSPHFSQCRRRGPVTTFTGASIEWQRVHNQSIASPSSSKRLMMGLEINIRIVGRKNSIESTSFLQESYEIYTKRLSSTIQLTTTFHKSNDDLIKNLQTDSKKGYGIVCLDERGDMYTSTEFSVKMYNWLEEYGSRLVFVIGAADGLPTELKQYQYSNQYRYNQGSKKKSGNDSIGVLNRSPMFMSLSKMTFTHPWARTILVEQIYRASEIHKGTGYHKE